MRFLPHGVVIETERLNTPSTVLHRVEHPVRVTNGDANALDSGVPEDLIGRSNPETIDARLGRNLVA
jgi:hypothetical protein